MTIIHNSEPKLLAAQLISAHERATCMIGDLQDEQLLGPKLATVNPPLWEIGHIAWFQEYWCLRHNQHGALGESILPQGDALYDSAKIAHDTRWELPLLTLSEVSEYRADVLERVLLRLHDESGDPDLAYFVQLATLHEDMHAEAFHYTRQTLGYSAPELKGATATVVSDKSTTDIDSDVHLRGGAFMLGTQPGPQFTFDNEKWAHEVHIAPFQIARTALSNAQYQAFVDADGYLTREWWSEQGWAWRESSGLQAPRYWTKNGSKWQVRRFDRTESLIANHPVVHVNWHEAQAYCRFAKRRLPTEAEWEYAAAYDVDNTNKRRYPWGNHAIEKVSANLQSSGVAAVDAYPAGDSACGARQMIGNVWEWTDSTFNPYPGFVIDPYKEYSQPWFGNHKVLRGGSFATTRRLIHNTWRNFYTPDRGDIFAGFRTCALT